jgi:hypothetical protein
LPPWTLSVRKVSPWRRFERHEEREEVTMLTELTTGPGTGRGACGWPIDAPMGVTCSALVALASFGVPLAA